MSYRKARTIGALLNALNNAQFIHLVLCRLFLESNVTKKNISAHFSLDHYVISPHTYFGDVETKESGIDVVADRDMTVGPAGGYTSETKSSLTFSNSGICPGFIVGKCNCDQT